MKILFFYFFIFLFFLGCENPRVQKIFNRAVQDWDNRQYEEALQNFIAVSRTYPENDLADDALYWVANIYQNYLSLPEQALVYYRNLIRQYPDSEFYIQSNFSIAKIYEEGSVSDIENAIYIYQDLLNHNSIQAEKVIMAYWRIVNNYFKINQFQNVRSVLKTMYSKYSQDEEILANIYHITARSYEMEGKLKFAEITYKEALKKIQLKESKKKLQFQLANILEEIGELKQALEFYQILQKDADTNEEKEYQFKVDALKNRLRKITK